MTSNVVMFMCSYPFTWLAVSFYCALFLSLKLSLWERLYYRIVFIPPCIFQCEWYVIKSCMWDMAFFVLISCSFNDNLIRSSYSFKGFNYCTISEKFLHESNWHVSHVLAWLLMTITPWTVANSGPVLQVYIFIEVLTLMHKEMC